MLDSSCIKNRYIPTIDSFNLTVETLNHVTSYLYTSLVKWTDGGNFYGPATDEEGGAMKLSNGSESEQTIGVFRAK